MDAFVHFTVGLGGGLLALLLVNWPTQREFLVMFASGVWALVPDGHWMLHEAGFHAPASLWRAAHHTTAANLFWFHQIIDRAETGRPKVEMGVALVGLLLVVGVYYVVNDWSSR
jgi:hypothetical protein